MNWHERIAAAEKNGGFRDEDVRDAHQWPDCACGEQDPRIPRGDSGEPKDQRLWSLGDAFAYDVAEHDYESARARLAAIERRAAELLAAPDVEA